MEFTENKINWKNTNIGQGLVELRARKSALQTLLEFIYFLSQYVGRFIFQPIFFAVWQFIIFKSWQVPNSGSRIELFFSGRMVEWVISVLMCDSLIWIWHIWIFKSWQMDFLAFIENFDWKLFCESFRIVFHGYCVCAQAEHFFLVNRVKNQKLEQTTPYGTACRSFWYSSWPSTVPVN